MQSNLYFFFEDFNGICFFLDRFSKNTQISNCIEIWVGTELVHEDGQADGEKDRQTDRHDWINPLNTELNPICQ